MTEIRVTAAHARIARLDRGSKPLCTPGIRTWMERYGLDLDTFLEHGLPVEQFDRIDDAFAQRLAAIAREEAARGQ